MAAWQDGKSRLDLEQAQALREWRWEKTGEEDLILTSSGQLELWLLGRRFRDRLSDLGFEINLENNVVYQDLTRAKNFGSLVLSFPSPSLDEQVFHFDPKICVRGGLPVSCVTAGGTVE